MPSIEELLSTIHNGDFCHFNLLFEERLASWVETFDRHLRTPLTNRERTVCYLIRLGKSVKDIAQLMSLSEHTVRSYTKQVHLKLIQPPHHHWLKTLIEERA